jgi:hypothetical protein
MLLARSHVSCAHFVLQSPSDPSQAIKIYPWEGIMKSSGLSLRSLTLCRVPLAVVLVVVLAGTAIAAIMLFNPSRDTTGTTPVVSSDPTTLNIHNEYFSPSAEGSTNGQACVTSHKPSSGTTITVPFINETFTATNGTDPLFRSNDTANNPFSTTSTAAEYSVFLSLGTTRIGEKVQQASTANNTRRSEKGLGMWPAFDLLLFTDDLSQTGEGLG